MTALGSGRQISVPAWRNAVFGVFALTGIAIATWAARIPAVKADLSLTTGGVAVLLFALAAGSIVGLVVAPAVLARLGARRGLLTCICVFAVALGLAGVAIGLLGSTVLTCVALAVFGFTYSVTDVLMNVEGADAERAIGKTVMPLMHAFFSVGTIVGAALGAVASAVGLPVLAHFTLMTAVIVAGGATAIRFIPAAGADTPGGGPSAVSTPRPESWRDRARESLALWRDVRLLLIGVLMLGMAFTEGSANDWISLAAVDGHGYSPTTGALVYGTFVAAMTVGRVCGGPLIDRYGRFALLAGTALLGIAGLLFFILADAAWLILLGAALWGIGGSLGFPVGVSAAADHPTEAARRVSIVAIFGYAAFLVGPPVLGVLGERYGILTSLYVVIALLGVSLLVTPAARPRVAEQGPRVS